MYEWIDHFMLTLIDLSKTGIFVILGVILVRYFLRNAPKKYSYFLWIIVAVRLLCPFSIESIFSIFNIEKVITPMVENGSVVDNIVSYSQPLYYENRLFEHTHSYLGGYSPMSGPSYQYFGFWIFIILFILLYIFFSYTDIQKITKYAIRLKENVFQSENVKSPFVLGFFKPKIYIPYGLDDETLDIILKHESYHIQRKDHILRFIGIFLCIIYWFNPFVWLAYKLFIEDMEMSCDEHVLLSKDNKTYSTTLLSFATNQFSKPKPLSFGESSISKRIKNSLKWKLPDKKTMILSLCLSLFVLVSFTSNPTKQDNISDLLRKHSIDSVNQITEKYYEYGYECEITSWAQLYRFKQWFDVVKLSKFEIESSSSNISTSYTIMDDNHQITLHFTNNYDTCIVETNDSKTAYRILNSDAAQSVFKQYYHDINYWPIWNDKIDSSITMNSYIRLIESYKNHEFELKKCAFVQLDISGAEDCYVIKGDYECNENEIIITSLEDKNVFVFDIEVDGYDSFIRFNESKSIVNSKEIIDTLNLLTFTSNYDEIYEVK